MKKILIVMSVACLAGSVFAADYSADLKQLLSKLQSMGHGTYTDQEWSEALSNLDSLATKAEQAGDWDQAVEASVIKAMVWSDMRGEPARAVSILEDAKTKYGSHRVPAMRKVYVREAEAYAKLGDGGAVQRVMDEFQASPHFDPEFYGYRVGEGRNTPVTIMRPQAGAAGSISATAITVARQKSQFAPGASFPTFSVTDIQGRSWSDESLRGKVYLVDFWARKWTPWERDLENLRAYYQRHHSEGFEVVGINIEPEPGDLAAVATAQRIGWPLVAGDRALTKELGIFGEATNYLVDRNGVIIGRDLHGADLAAAVKRALAQ